LGREGVARILITNRNHVRKAMVVREQSGAPVTIHPDDAAYARQQGATIDAELRPGERIGPLTVVGVPGKSPGEVALPWPERRLARAARRRSSGVPSLCAATSCASRRGCAGADGSARSSDASGTSATGGTTRRAAAR